MNELTELQQNIVFGIAVAIIYGALLFALIFGLIYSVKKFQNQKKYIETLNDHDKAVIKTYESMRAFKKEETK